MTKAKKAELGKRLDRLENKGDAIIKALEELTKILVERQPLILSEVCGHPGCDLVPRMKALTERSRVAQSSMARKIKQLGVEKLGIATPKSEDEA